MLPVQGIHPASLSGPEPVEWTKICPYQSVLCGIIIWL